MLRTPAQGKGENSIHMSWRGTGNAKKISKMWMNSDKTPAKCGRKDNPSAQREKEAQIKIYHK